MVYVPLHIFLTDVSQGTSPKFSKGWCARVLRTRNCSLVCWRTTFHHNHWLNWYTDVPPAVQGLRILLDINPPLTAFRVIHTFKLGMGRFSVAHLAWPIRHRNFSAEGQLGVKLALLCYSQICSLSLSSVSSGVLYRLRSMVELFL